MNSWETQLPSAHHHALQKYFKVFHNRANICINCQLQCDTVLDLSARSDMINRIIDAVLEFQNAKVLVVTRLRCTSDLSARINADATWFTACPPLFFMIADCQMMAAQFLPPCICSFDKIVYVGTDTTVIITIDHVGYIMEVTCNNGQLAVPFRIS